MARSTDLACNACHQMLTLSDDDEARLGSTFPLHELRLFARATVWCKRDGCNWPHGVEVRPEGMLSLANLG